jgi:hypothetical protein
MDYNADALARTRAASRLNFSRGNILPPGYLARPFVDPFTRTMYQVKLALPEAPVAAEAATPELTDALARLLAERKQPPPAEIPRRPPRPGLGGQIRTYSHDITTAAVLGASAVMTTELLGQPAIVRDITMSRDTVMFGTAEFLVTSTLNAAPTDAEVLGSSIIFPDPASGLLTYGIDYIAGAQQFTVRLGRIIPTAPFRLASWLRNIDAAAHRIIVHITTQDLDPEDLRALSVPTVFPEYALKRSLTVPGPAAPRGKAAPRALTLKTFSDGRMTFSRSIPWSLVDDVVKREFLVAYVNNQVPPTMEPIW